MKENNYNSIPTNEDYIPRHASNDNNLNYISAKDTTIHSWNEEFIKQNNNDTDTTKSKSNNILDNLDKIDCSKYYKVDLDSNKEKEEKQPKNKKKKNNKWLWIVLLIIFIIIIIISSLKIILWLKDNKKTKDTVNEINNIADVIEKKDDENTELVNKEENTTSD